MRLGPELAWPPRKASALKAFIRGVVLVANRRFGSPVRPLIANDQSDALSRLLAWSSLAAVAVALLVAIYFTFPALTIREPQREIGFRV